MEKAGSLFVGLPFVYSVVCFSIFIVVYFSITIYRYALLIDIRGIARSVGVIDLAEELTYQCETMLWVVFVGATGVGPKV